MQELEATTLEPLRALEQRRADAMNAADLRTLEDLLAPGVLYVHGNGIADDRASYLAGLASGASRYRAVTFTDIRLVTGDDLVCVVAGTMRGYVIKAQGEVALHSLYLAVWQRPTATGTHWQLMAFQATRAA